MRKFERIATDPNINNGLPSIRDTGITVSEVVKVAQAGKPVNEIIEAYPNLNVEDIFEAQAFSIGGLLESIAVYRNEGITPLVVVKGYCELLLDKIDNKHFEIDIESKLKYVESMYHAAHRGIAEWQNLSEWARLNYDYEPITTGLIKITELETLIKTELIHYDPRATITINASNEISDKGIESLIYRAILNLSTEFSNTLKLDTLLFISPSVDNTLHFEIKRESKYQDSLDGFARYAFDSYPAPIGIAKTIIRCYGGGLEIRTNNNVVIFSFNLPTNH